MLLLSLLCCVLTIAIALLIFRFCVFTFVITSFSVQCAAGTFLNETLKQCQLCPIGYITVSSDMTSCKECPSGNTTLQFGATVCYGESIFFILCFFICWLVLTFYLCLASCFLVMCSTCQHHNTCYIFCCVLEPVMFLMQYAVFIDKITCILLIVLL